jgi:glutathione S-transferase
MRAHWVLEELCLPYETEEIIPRTASMKREDFRAVSPRCKVPVLQEDDLVIGESAAIVTYLADRHRDTVALSPPPGSEARARHDELCWLVMTELDAPLYVIRRHQGLPDVYGASPVAVRAAGEYFLRLAGELERRLSDGRTHLMGDAFTCADLLLTTCTDWATFLGLEPPPGVAAHRERTIAREAYSCAAGRNYTAAAMAALSAPRTA